MPNLRAKAATSQLARSLYEPEGLQVSSLRYRCGIPSSVRNRSGAHNGVWPTGIAGKKDSSTGRGMEPLDGFSPSQEHSSIPRKGSFGF